MKKSDSDSLAVRDKKDPQLLNCTLTLARLHLREASSGYLTAWVTQQKETFVAKEYSLYLTSELPSGIVLYDT